jgi:hypothetical protein
MEDGFSVARQSPAGPSVGPSVASTVDRGSTELHGRDPAGVLDVSDVSVV